MILQDNGSIPIYTRMLRCGLDLDGFSDVPISNGLGPPCCSQMLEGMDHGGLPMVRRGTWIFWGRLDPKSSGISSCCQVMMVMSDFLPKKSLPRSSHGKSWSNRELQDVSLANLPNQRPKSPDTSEARRCFDRCSFHYQGLDGLLRSGLEDFRLHRLHGPCR